MTVQGVEKRYDPSTDDAFHLLTKITDRSPASIVYDD